METFTYILSAATPYLLVALLSSLFALKKTNTHDAPIVQIMFAFFYGMSWGFRAIKAEAA